MKQKNQEKKSKQSKQKDENAPKKAKCAYIFYQNECLPKKEEMFGTAVDIKNAGGLMKCIELDEVQKEKYKQMAEQDNQRYEQQMKEYKNTGTFQGQKDIIRERQERQQGKNSSSENDLKQIMQSPGKRNVNSENFNQNLLDQQSEFILKQCLKHQ